MSSPIIVGATGGSGTRVVQQIIAAQNIYMGAPLNPEKDSLIIGAFLEHHINPVLSHTRSLNYALADLPENLRNQTLAALKNAVETLLAYKPENQSRWGFKNPRSIFMLPFFQALYPDFMFVHVVRDGRDIALSSNKNQPLKHFHAAIPDLAIPADSPEAAIRLWAKVNHEAAAWCAQYIKNNYVRVHYEALCANPEQEINKLFSALHLPQNNIDALLSMIDKPSAIGRWRKLPEAMQATLISAARAALHEFGYAE